MGLVPCQHRIQSVLDSSETFYGEVLQKLRPWKAAPPKLKKSAEPEESPEEAIAEVVGVEPEQIAPIAEGSANSGRLVSSMEEQGGFHEGGLET